MSVGEEVDRIEQEIDQYGHPLWTAHGDVSRCTAGRHDVRCSFHSGHGPLDGTSTDASGWDHGNPREGAWWNVDVAPGASAPAAPTLTHLATALQGVSGDEGAGSEATGPYGADGGYAVQAIRASVMGSMRLILIVAYPLEHAVRAEAISEAWAAFERRSGVDVMLSFGPTPEVVR